MPAATMEGSVHELSAVRLSMVPTEQSWHGFCAAVGNFQSCFYAVNVEKALALRKRNHQASMAYCPRISIIAHDRTFVP